MNPNSVYLATVAGNPDTLIRLHPTDDEMVESFGKVAGQHWHSLALVADIRPAAVVDSGSLGGWYEGRLVATGGSGIYANVEKQWQAAQR